ncbi:cobamide remodeling phosphodiesterase CbiR [Halodesulfovibrio marinisediminis]|uniref:Sugar phosphate isomerase/epimerase n=1 Tax=Halodesulfovibrio marinisediminis DSM 17456 TaxID=1121457 RepID=A0A1N6EXT4_9BACT|nr:cobamide remodeling phosphodiesterase CbiR [Halodesulfovibrio marinisediminis]SIN87875.1 Sugar phosphate isomerase/epimerase [Halodesulfovibrio marinisediminis DSM 17456]
MDKKKSPEQGQGDGVTLQIQGGTCPPEATTLQNSRRQIPVTTAAPSWVMPGSVYENCVFLEDKVDEVSLLFFESESCLAYSEDDLPQNLAELDLTYHMHLPLDLPWSNAEVVADTVLRLMDKVAFLDVRQAVLHPPLTKGENAFSVKAAQQLLVVLARAWNSHGFSCNDLLIENIEGADLIDLAPVIGDLGLGVCIDIGHIIAYGHDALLGHSHLFDRLRMIHVNAPEDVTTAKGRSKHVGLEHLDESGRDVARKVLQACGQECTLVYELFNWKHIETTIPVVEELFFDGRAIE